VILEWDPEKAASNLIKQRVDFHEAGTVLDDPLSTTFPDPVHSVDEQRVWAYPCSSPYRPGKSSPSHQCEDSDPDRAKVL
jgi:hypothetical protein